MKKSNEGGREEEGGFTHNVVAYIRAGSQVYDLVIIDRNILTVRGSATAMSSGTSAAASSCSSSSTA